MADFTPVSHIVFDCDGLLVNSEHFYTLALTEACAKYGKEFTFQIKAEMMGTTPLEGAAICLERLGLTGKVELEDFIKNYESVLHENCHKIELMAGAERLINHLATNKVPMAIATGASETGFQKKTGHIGDILRKPFSHHVFAGSDPQVKHGKPFPDVFLAAAQRFSEPPKSPQNVLVFEDAINGVKAAQAAGMQVILVPDPRLDLDNMPVKPTQIIKSLSDFQPELYKLPPFLKQKE